MNRKRMTKDLRDIVWDVMEKFDFDVESIFESGEDVESVLLETVIYKMRERGEMPKVKWVKEIEPERVMDENGFVLN